MSILLVGQAAAHQVIAPTGAQAEDYFGQAVAVAGDWNGDGHDDMLVGAPGPNYDLGRAFIFFGGPGADDVPDVIFEPCVDCPDAAAWADPSGQLAAPENFGSDVTGLGDFNGDGADDVAVSIRSQYVGMIYVFLGGAGADALPDLVISADPAAIGVFNLGLSIDGGGDWNGDGYTDLAAGAPEGYGANGDFYGKVFIFFGGPDADANADVVLTGTENSARFGERVVWAGDLDGDTHDDLLVGEPRHGYPSNRGRVFAYFGGPAADSAADLVIDGEEASSNFGREIAALGDVDGDGWDDFLVAAPTYNGGRSAVLGRAYMYRGGPGLDPLPDLVITGSDIGGGERLGRSVAAVGDQNGDGWNDFALGTWMTSGYALDQGFRSTVSVFHGGPNLDANADVKICGPAGTLSDGGHAISGGGTFAASPTMFVGARTDASAGLRAGRAYVVSDLSALQCDAGGPYEGDTGVPILFDGTGSSDPDGTILAYEWGFDGQVLLSTGTQSYAYFTAGVYEPTLTVTSDWGDLWAVTECATTATVIGNAACAQVAPDVYAWWPGNGGAEDVTTGLDGTLMNGASIVGGLVGNAFSFDGLDDYLSLDAHAAALNFSGPATFEAWIQGTQSNCGTLFTIHDGGTNNAIRIRIGSCGGLITGALISVEKFQFGIPWSAGAYVTPDVSQLLDGAFHHVAVVFDGVQTQIFLDGVAMPMTRYGSDFGPYGLLTSVTEAKVGGFVEVPFVGIVAEPYQGLLDELTLYQRALGVQEIAAIHAAGAAGKCVGSATVTVSGTVTSDCDGPVSGVGVTLVDADGGSRSTSTGPDGSYLFVGVSESPNAGQVTIAVPEGTTAATTAIPVTLDQDQAAIDFSLDCVFVSVSGTVSSGCDGPLSGIELTLVDGDGVSHSEVTVNGAYTFAGIRYSTNPGSLTVLVPEHLEPSDPPGAQTQVDLQVDQLVDVTLTCTVVETILYSEDFENGPAGWTPVDLNEQETYWHQTTYAGRGVMWCGAEDACWAGGSGYGNLWRQTLSKTIPLGGPTSEVLEVSWMAQLDMEPPRSTTARDYWRESLHVSAVYGENQVLAIVSGSSREGLETSAVGQLTNVGPPDADGFRRFDARVEVPQEVEVEDLLLRFHFGSDQRSSDADGWYPTDGAVRLDWVEVKTIEGATIARDEFESNDDGWSTIAPSGRGGTFRLEEDPPQRPDLLGFPPGNSAWVASDPTTGLFPLNSPYRNTYVRIGIESPPIVVALPPELDPAATRLLLQFDVYDDLPVESGAYWRWDATGGSCPKFLPFGRWAGNDETGVQSQQVDITSTVDGDEEILVRLLGLAVDDPLSHTRVHTEAPYFDNVVIRAVTVQQETVDISGVVWTANRGDAVAGIEVNLVRDGLPTLSTTTNAGGYYAFLNVSPFTGEATIAAGLTDDLVEPSAAYASSVTTPLTGSGRYDLWVERRDPDGDGIADSIDSDPVNFTDAFSDVALDGTTEGVIGTRGGHSLTILERANPEGVYVATGPETGTEPARIELTCGGSVITAAELGRYCEMVITCGSSTVEVLSGTIALTFHADGGGVATATLTGGQSIRFVPETFTFWSPAINEGPVVVTVDGQDVSIEPGEITEITGSLAGTITTDCPEPGTGLHGVEVDLFDVSTGLLVATTVTDASGHYGLEDLPVGDYTVTVVSPLGQTIDSEDVPVSLSGGGATTVDYGFSCQSIVPDQRSNGFWKHQVGVALSGRGSAEIEGDRLCIYLDTIANHFNSNQINQVVVYEPPASSECLDKLQVASDLLNLKGQQEMIARARQHFMSLLLNVASGRLSLRAIISADGATASQAITYCDFLIDNANADHELAKSIADAINNGEQIAAGVIPLTTLDIAYKGVDARFVMDQNQPNPFNPSTTISMSLPAPGDYRVSIYDAAGRLVRTLVGRGGPGRVDVNWNGKDDQGVSVGSGVYYYRGEAAGITHMRKMILLR